MFSFNYVRFNNYCMPNLYNPFGFGGYFNCYNPYMNFGCFYNPFSVFNTAMQLISGNFPAYNDYTNYHKPAHYPANCIFNSYTPQYSNFDYSSFYNGMYPVKDYSKEMTQFPAPIISAMPNYNYTDMSMGYVSTPDNFRNLYSNDSASAIKLDRSYLNKEFLDKVKQIAQNINCDYQDLLAVMNSESGLDPSSVHKNRSGKKTAAGLIQFTENGAIAELNKTYGLNLTVEKISNMSAIEQLDLVEKYYKTATKKFNGKKLTAADLYALTYVPAYAKNEILTRRGDGYYEGNEGLDENGDGMVTKSDLNRHLAKKRVSLDTFA